MFKRVDSRGIAEEALRLGSGALMRRWTVLGTESVRGFGLKQLLV